MLYNSKNAKFYVRNFYFIFVEYHSYDEFFDWCTNLRTILLALRQVIIQTECAPISD